MSENNVTLNDMLDTMSTQSIGDFPSSVFSDVFTRQFYWAVNFVVKPSIAIVGLFGNVLSIMVISRQGLKKCSNILLLVLTVADLFVSIGNINFAYLLYIVETPPNFRFSREINEFLFIMYSILSCLKGTGVQCSFTLPLIITLERIIAIFFPFHFHWIVTPSRTWLVVTGIYCLYAGLNIYNAFHFQLVQSFVGGNVVGKIMFTNLYFTDTRSRSFDILNVILNNLSGAVPMLLVSAGCFIIGVYLKILSSRRRKLTSETVNTRIKPRSMFSKSTKTLLSVCVLYVICSGTGYICDFVKEYYESDLNFQYMMHFISEIVLSLNCSCNFVIYVVMNENFRDGYSKILRCKILKPS